MLEILNIFDYFNKINLIMKNIKDLNQQLELANEIPVFNEETDEQMISVVKLMLQNFVDSTNKKIEFIEPFIKNYEVLNKIENY